MTITDPAPIRVMQMGQTGDDAIGCPEGDTLAALWGGHRRPPSMGMLAPVM
jgi:hypothetical protein